MDRTCFIKVLGKRVRYLKKGTGPPIVLIHGLGNFMICWTKNINALSKRFSVYALDLPGHGYSDPLKKDEMNLAFSSLFLENFFKVLGLNQFICVGESLGGLIAMRYVIDYPGRVQKLVLVNSAGLGRGASLFLRLMSLPIVGEYFSRPSNKMVRQMLERLVYDKKCVPKHMVNALVLVRSAKELRQNMLGLLRYGVNFSGQRKHIIQTKQLKHIKIPTLLLWGENDPLFSVKQARRAVKYLPNAVLQVFPKTGHLLPMEKPREFEKAVVEFAFECS